MNSELEVRLVGLLEEAHENARIAFATKLSELEGIIDEEFDADKIVKDADVDPLVNLDVNCPHCHLQDEPGQEHWSAFSFIRNEIADHLQRGTPLAGVCAYCHGKVKISLTVDMVALDELGDS